MKRILVALALAVATTSNAHAASLSLNNANLTLDGFTNGVPTTYTGTSEGVKFTIDTVAGEAAINNFGDGGLLFGPGGWQTVSITADADIRMTSIEGFGPSGFPIFYSAPNYGPFSIGFSGLLVPAEVNLFDGGVDLMAGEAFIIDAPRIQFTDLTLTVSKIGFDVAGVTPPTSEVPLPASGLLLVAGLAGLAAWRRRQAA